MSDLINKWNKNKNKNQKSREGKAMQLKYWDNSQNKIKHSFSNVAKDIIEDYLSRDDIKELLEQIDKENTNE